MEVYIKRTKKIINGHKSDLEPTIDEIFAGVKEGIKLGIADGLKRGVKEGLGECLSKGLSNIGQEDLIDLCKDIQEDAIREAIKQGSKPLFEKPAKEYVNTICPKIREKLKSENIVLTENETGVIRDIALKSEQKMMAEMIQKLPINPLVKPIIDGIDKAIEESFEESFKECEKEILTN